MESNKMSQSSFVASALSASPVTYIAVGAVLWVLILVHNRYQHGMAAFPGPFAASLSDLWRLFYSYANQHEKPMAAIHRKYGDIVRMGPHMLSFACPEAVKDIYGPGKNFAKSEFYSVIAPVSKGVIKDTLFSTRDQKYHSSYRRSVNPAFSMSSVLRYESHLDETTELFLRRLDDEAARSGTGVIDLPRLFQYYAFDAVGMLAYSKRYGFVEQDKDIDGIIESTRFILDYTSHMGNYPSFDAAVLKNNLMLFLGKLGIVNMTTPLIPFAHKSQASRMQELEQNSERKQQNRDILDSYLEAHTNKPDVITKDEVTELGVMLGFAGSESTGVALSSLVYHVVRDPQVYSKLQAEINEKLSNSGPHVSYEETQTLPYFDACIKEAFRVHPPSSFIMERVVPPQGAQIAGRAVPGGTIVGCDPWAVHRHKPTFGEDVETYRPQRWIEGGGKEPNEMWKAMIHFGAGPHMCMGKNISIMEVYKLGATMFKNFKISLDQPEKECGITAGQFVRMEFGVRLERISGNGAETLPN